MATTHSLDKLKLYHNEAIQFFAAELMLLKDIIPRITDQRLSQAATLLISCGRTGAALIQLVKQPDAFRSESVMLARSFIEKITNFCYVSICDKIEYRAFVLHPIYKNYHNVQAHRMEDDLSSIAETLEARKKKQEDLKKIPVVQEALAIFSETNPRLTWTRKSLAQRIDAIREWGKMLDVFFTISKIQYYSDASEALHGSLYGCTYDLGVFDPDFDHTNETELEKKLCKDNTCVLLHLGMLIHESLTLISYSSDIREMWDHSYKNRGRALNLLFHVLEIKSDSKK